MNKRELAKIPRPEPIPTEDSHGALIFLTTEEVDTSDGHVLILNAFMQKHRDTGIIPEQRTFFTEEDYITQDLTTTKTKWKTCALYNDWWFEERQKQFVSMEHYERFRKFLKDYRYQPNSWKPNPTIWDDCRVYQESVLKLRLKKTHQAEKDAIDEKMAILGDVPEEFFTWVHDDAMRESQYLFFRPKEKGKNIIRCKCSVCGQRFETDRRIISAKHGEKGECPECASPVTFKSTGIWPKQIHDYIFVTYVERTSDGFCMRYFHASREYSKSEACENGLDPVGIEIKPDSYYEVAREFFSYRNGTIQNSAYQYDFFKNTKDLRWCKWRDHSNMGSSSLYRCYQSCLYPGNLPEAWEHTPMKYSALEILSAKTPGKTGRYYDAACEPEKFRAVELLTKAGLYNLAHHILNGDSIFTGDGKAINAKGKNLGQILMLDMKGKKHPNKNNIRMLRQIDATFDMLANLQTADRLGVTFRPDVLVWYTYIFGENKKLIDPKNRKASLQDICRYLEDVKSRNKKKDIRSIAKDWRDYIGWAKELGRDLRKKDVYFPLCFYTTHDYYYKEYLAYTDRLEAEKKRKNEIMAQHRMELVKAFMEEVFDQNEGKDAFNIRGKGLILLVPKDAQEIRKEGEALHHCVGTYVNRVASGETSILFVRQAKEPDVPYFTMEWRDGKVQQCRGKRNCDMTPEVKAFTKAFEAKMNEAIAEKEKAEVMKNAG